MGEGPERSDVIHALPAIVASLLTLGDGWHLAVLPSGQLAIVQDMASEQATATVLLTSDEGRG